MPYISPLHEAAKLPTAAPTSVPTYESPATGSTRRRQRPKTKGKGTLVASSVQIAQAIAAVIPIPTADMAPTPTTAPETEFVMPHGFAYVVIDPNTSKSQNYGQLIQGPDADNWVNGCTDNMGSLLLGIDPKSNNGTGTIRFIRHDEVPAGIVVDIRPQEEETHRVRFTCGRRCQHHCRHLYNQDPPQ